MVKYYEVKKVRELGNLVAKYEPVKADQVYKASAHTIAIIFNGFFSIAIDVTTLEEYDYANSYKFQWWLNMDLYQVSTEHLGLCHHKYFI